MSSDIVYSKEALNAAIRGEYGRLNLKIERKGSAEKFTLSTHQEVGKIKRVASQIFSCITRGNTTWASPDTVRAFCKKLIGRRLKANVKCQKILHKFLNLVHNGCVLDRKYEMEIPYLHPDKQCLSFYHQQLARHYQDRCKDQTLDMTAWYRTEEGQFVLEQVTDIRDIDAFKIHYFSNTERASLAVEFKKIDSSLRLFVQGKLLRTLSEGEKGCVA